MRLVLGVMVMGIGVALLVSFWGWIPFILAGRRPTVWGLGHNSVVKIKKTGQYAMVLEEDEDPLPLVPWGKFRVLPVKANGAFEKKHLFRRWQLRRLDGWEKKEAWSIINSYGKVPLIARKEANG